MNILFVVGHPAHVHLFRNPIAELRGRGHHVQVAAVAKETTLNLLAAYGLEPVVVGRNLPGMGPKLLDLPRKDFRLLRLLKKERTDLVVSTGSPYAAQASAIRGIPHVAFSDTEIAGAVLKLMLPFTDAVCTPTAFSLDLGKKHVRYRGYKELAYLHPARFQPEPSVLNLVGASRGDRLIIVRFATWDSSHDIAAHGVDDADLVSFVRHLESHGRVLITSERPLPRELDDYLLKIPLDRVHDLLFFATLYIGEGATMASEAGVLGTPWIFVSSENRGYLRDQEQTYGLGFWETSARSALNRADLLLSDPGLKTSWEAKRHALLLDMIDVTDFIVKFLDEWPDRQRDGGRRLLRSVPSELT